MFLYNIFQNDLQSLISEFFITLIIIILLLFGVFLTITKKTSKTINSLILNPLIIYLIFYIFCLTWFIPQPNNTVCNGVLICDSFSQFTHLFLLICLFCHFVIQQQCFDNQKTHFFENNILILLSILGLFLLSSAYHLITFYLALELQSLSFYILTASKKNSPVSSEAALKYFILGAIASGIILLGSSIIYGFTGSLNFGDLQLLLLNINHYELLQFITPVFYGFFLFLIGLFFKIGAAPFHTWLPDVYEGAPNHLTFFFAILPKIALITIFIRLFFDICYNISNFFIIIFYTCAVLSILIGSFLSLQQKKIKRLLAFSSISHVGFMFIGFTSISYDNILYILFYLIMYIVMSINIWTIFLSYKKKNKPVQYLTDLTNFSKINPLLSIIIVLNMFSMAGIPPLGGFFSKMFLFTVALKNNVIGLAILGILLSVICSVYYIKVIKILFFDNGVIYQPVQTINKSSANIITLTFFFICFFIMFPEYLLFYLKKISFLFIL